MNQDALMLYCPETGLPKPYPSHTRQWRKYHGPTAWLYNPWTGASRDARDIGSDVFGHLIVAPGEKVEVAKPLSICAADRDGKCIHPGCPWIRDGFYSRKCPLPKREES